MMDATLTVSSVLAQLALSAVFAALFLLGAMWIWVRLELRDSWAGAWKWLWRRQESSRDSSSHPTSEDTT